MHRTVSPLLVTLPFLTAVTGAGVMGFTSTALPTAQSTILTGGFQRLYEDGFSESLPFDGVAHTAYTALTLAAFGQAGPAVVVADGDWVFTIEEFQAPATPTDLEAALVAARDALAAEGITLLPVIVPDKARVYGDLLPRSRGAAFETRYADALATLGRLGFPSIDLATELSDARATAPTFMRTDTHWSPFGAEVAAYALAEAAGLTGQGTAQFETTWTTGIAFDGDLRPFVDTGAFQPLIGPAAEVIEVPTTVALDAGQGLFGDVATDIVLIGTSFSARSEFNFAGFLQQATGITVVNLAVEGQGPFAPMQAALTSGAITDLSPTLVIWDIPERYISPRSLP